MQRWYSAAFYKRRINALKNVLPHVGLFTDIMVGFPGENQARFKESLDLIKEIEFSGLHVFRYSQRAKTPAARYEGQIPEKEISARASEMRRLDHDLRAAFAARAVGSRRRVVAELSGREALTEGFLPVKLEKEIRRPPPPPLFPPGAPPFGVLSGGEASSKPDPPGGETPPRRWSPCAR